MADKSKFSSTPASVIYSQSWPVPASNSVSLRYAAKAYSNSQKKSLDNSPWNYKAKQQVKRPPKASTSVHKPHSWASSMLSNNYPEWFENDADVVLDMAKEFKITLQMFKKLTDQVKEVDEQLSSGRRNYSFKHYFSHKNHHNTRRSNRRTYTPEIPMTNEEYQPCNNFHFKRKQQQAPSQFRIYRKMEECHHNPSNTKHEVLPLPKTLKEKPEKWRIQESFVDVEDTENSNHDSRFLNEHIQNLTIAEYSDGDISWSTCLEFGDEENNIGLGYIDPAPEDWEVRKLEELELKYSPDQSGKDPFMARYLQLRRLEIETVELEKGNGSSLNSVPDMENGANKVTLTNKSGKKLSSSKKQSTKINRSFENVNKNPRRVLKKSSNSASSLHDFEKDCAEQGVKNFKTENKSSRKDSEKVTKEAKIESSAKTTRCKSSRGRRRVQSCKTRPFEPYRSSVTYDILEIATSFEPPSIERIKFKSRPVTAKSAKSKGMIPGKTCTSQRRFSLTAGQSLPSDSSDPAVFSKSRTSSAKQSSKKSTKRCRSSKF